MDTFVCFSQVEPVLFGPVLPSIFIYLDIQPFEVRVTYLDTTQHALMTSPSSEYACMSIIIRSYNVRNIFGPDLWEIG